MHPTSYALVNTFAEHFLDAKQHLRIIDIGSYDVNGSFKPIFSKPNWEYKGLDMAPGPNVDIVAPAMPWPLADNSYDVVVSGQCLEHVEAPWIWIKEIERICKPGGFIMVIAPWQYPIHRFPVDCWRILPDGMSYLLSKWCHCELLGVGTVDANVTSEKGSSAVGDCYGLARKLTPLPRMGSSEPHSGPGKSVPPSGEQSEEYKDPAEWHTRALKLAEVGQIQAALDALKALVAKHPDAQVALNDLGVLYFRTGRTDEAVVCLEQAAAMAPGHLNTLKNLLDVYQALKRPADAARVCKQVLAVAPADVEAQRLLAKLQA